MTQIRILPEILSNQIAAGEVVQRPASVVKELVENSIDAGAERITVELEGGGKSLIRVSDDGCGLGRDEALLCIERYATSKIFTKEDLFAIGSFGFRGEALPSIASVSRFTLVTRTANSDIGTKIEIAGGKLVKVSDEGAPVGTLVEVKHLFFNTPARRKFLKGNTTESGHIADTVAGLALGNPHLGFRLFVNKKLVKNFPPGQDLFQRSLLVLGKDVTHKLYRLKGEEGDIFVSGVCSNPLVTRSTSGRIYLFVNNRLIYDRGLVAAVFRGYQGRIMKGRFPMGVVRVGLPFDQVDVNVHPTKREIKFLSPQPVYQAVGRAVEAALAAAQQDLVAYAKRAGTGDSPDPGAILYQKIEQRADRVAQSTLDWGQGAGGQSQKTIPGIPADPPEFPQRSEVTQSAKIDQTSDPLSEICGDEVCTARQSNPQCPVQPPAQPPAQPPSQFHVLGQVMGTYIIAEKENALVLVDQHAAHERVVYEGLKKRHHTLGVQSQDLLVPEVLELTHGEADCLTEILEALCGMGLRIEPFGGTCFVVKAVPPLLGERELKPLVLELVETFQQNSSLIEIQDACLVSMACHSALRANKQMNRQEMVGLLEDLAQCDNSLHCPHGRPTLVSFDEHQLKKLFKRLV
jgi:DNA mismatch repair protein MutL